MIRFAILFVLSVFLWTCADKPAPVAPAGKATDFDSLFDAFNNYESDSETPTAPADTSSTDSTITDSTVADADSVEVDFELPPISDPLADWVDTGSPEGDREAMLALWHAFGQPNLRKWGDKSLKKWEGVKTNDQGRVVELLVQDLDWSLSFAIPPEIGQLTQLKVLDISGTTGNLPPEIGNLRRLEHLAVGLGQDGDSVIPEEWGQLGLLKHLRIQCSGCTGAIPASFGNLSNLESLTIFARGMDGPLPNELGNLSRLKTLDLAGMDSLSGALPTSLGRLASLEVLKIKSVNLEGPLPSLTGARNLKVVEIEKRYHNSSGAYEWPIISTLPVSWGRLTNLEEIFLPNVEGTLPPEWATLDKLRNLWLSPAISGRLPPEWSGLRSLEQIGIVDQELEGPLPQEWAFMSNLSYVYLNDNLIEGPLPVLWSEMKNMRKIDLSFNFIDGPLPPEWGAWTELEIFECESCGLMGEIPSTWSAHTKLTKLDLSDNQLTGAPPDWWHNMTDLRELYLRENQFSGPFPKSLAEVPWFKERQKGWSLDEEGLTGCVPRALADRDMRAHIALESDGKGWERFLAHGRLHWCRN